MTRFLSGGDSPAASAPPANSNDPIALMQHVIGTDARILCTLETQQPGVRPRAIVTLPDGRLILADLRNCTALQIGKPVSLEDAADFATSILLGSQRAATSPEALFTLAMAYVAALQLLIPLPADAGAKSAPEAQMQGGAS